MVKDIQFNKVNEFYESTFTAENNKMSIFLLLDPGSDPDNSVIVRLYTSPDGEDFADRGVIVSKLGCKGLVKEDVGLGGVLIGQYIKLVSNSEVTKGKVLYE